MPLRIARSIATIDRNAGVTVVTVLHPFPDAAERLAERIRAYCRNGRTMREIEGRFRQSGASVVRGAVALLKKQGRMERMRNKGTDGLHGAVTRCRR